MTRARSYPTAEGQARLGALLARLTRGLERGTRLQKRGQSLKFRGSDLRELLRCLLVADKPLSEEEVRSEVPDLDLPKDTRVYSVKRLGKAARQLAVPPLKKLHAAPEDLVVVVVAVKGTIHASGEPLQDAAIAAIVSREHLRGQKLAKAVGALKLSGTGSAASGGGARIELLVRGLQPAIQTRIANPTVNPTLARAVMATVHPEFSKANKDTAHHGAGAHYWDQTATYLEYKPGVRYDSQRASEPKERTVNSLGRSQETVLALPQRYVTEEEAAALLSDQLLQAAGDASAALIAQCTKVLRNERPAADQLKAFQASLLAALAAHPLEVAQVLHSAAAGGALAGGALAGLTAGAAAAVQEAEAAATAAAGGGDASSAPADAAAAVQGVEPAAADRGKRQRGETPASERSPTPATTPSPSAAKRRRTH